MAAKEKLEIVNLRSEIHFARPPIPSPAKRDEDRIPFELISEYTAKIIYAIRKIGTATKKSY